MVKVAHLTSGEHIWVKALPIITRHIGFIILMPVSIVISNHKSFKSFSSLATWYPERNKKKLLKRYSNYIPSSGVSKSPLLLWHSALMWEHIFPWKFNSKTPSFTFWKTYMEILDLCLTPFFLPSDKTLAYHTPSHTLLHSAGWQKPLNHLPCYSGKYRYSRAETSHRAEDV